MAIDVRANVVGNHGTDSKVRVDVLGAQHGLRWAPGPVVPTLIDVRQGLIYGGQALHTSHALMYLRGISFCAKCGLLTMGDRVRGLTTACWMKPSSTCTQSYKLKRMVRGVHSIADNRAFPIGCRAPPHDIAPFLEPHYESLASTSGGTPIYMSGPKDACI